jgi:hypothetical protein
MGLLKRAQGIGALVHMLGAVLVVLSIAWASWILLQQKARLASVPVQ